MPNKLKKQNFQILFGLLIVFIFFLPSILIFLLSKITLSNMGNSTSSVPIRANINIEYVRSRYFEVGDVKRFIVELKFQNDDKSDFWFQAQDLMLNTADNPNFAPDYYAKNYNNSYIIPAGSNMTAEFVWDMPKSSVPDSITFLNDKKYGYTFDLGESFMVEPPQELIDQINLGAVDLSNNNGIVIDKTLEEYTNFVGKINAFLNDSLGEVEDFTLPEARVKFSLPKVESFYTYDNNDFFQKINKGLEPWYGGPRYDFTINKDTLEPSTELVPSKSYDINFFIASDSKLTKFSDQINVLIDAFPASPTVYNDNYVKNADQETLEIGGKKVRLYNYYVSEGSSDSIKKRFLIDLENGHNITITYSDTIRDEVLKIQDKQLRLKVIEKIISNLKTY